MLLSIEGESVNITFVRWISTIPAIKATLLRILAATLWHGVTACVPPPPSDLHRMVYLKPNIRAGMEGPMVRSLRKWSSGPPDWRLIWVGSLIGKLCRRTIDPFRWAPPTRPSPIALQTGCFWNQSLWSITLIVLFSNGWNIYQYPFFMNYRSTKHCILHQTSCRIIRIALTIFLE